MSVKNSVTNEEKRKKVVQGFQSGLANVKEVMHDFETRGCSQTRQHPENNKQQYGTTVDARMSALKF
jgi:hypothetical protein